MSNYKYPDASDEITIQFINEFEPYPDYWRQSEERILRRMEKTFEGRSDRLLDAGCGEGRLVERFHRNFKTIVAIEPDQVRIGRAMEKIQEPHVTFEHMDVQLYLDQYGDDNPFDTIVCSHIIQHVDTQTMTGILGALSRLLDSEGLLHLTTTHSAGEEDWYARSTIREGQATEEMISREVFDTEREYEGLNIRYFSYEALKSLLDTAGLEIVDWQVFHDPEAHRLADKILGTDCLINLTDKRKRSRGRDIYVQCKRKGRQIR